MTDSAEISSLNGDAAIAPERPLKRRRWPWMILVVSLGLIALAGWNAMIWYPVSGALKDEDSVSVVAYRRWLISPTAIVIDVRNVNGSASMADMDRNFFKAAEALKDRQVDTVVLAYRGKAKWLFAGQAFQTIGRERSFQNPVFVMRTMQQDVKTLDGSGAFPALSGGWLGVLGEELDQHKRFHEGWWLNDALGTSAGAAM